MRPKLPEPLRIPPPRAPPKIKRHKHGERQGEQKNHRRVTTCCELYALSNTRNRRGVKHHHCEVTPQSVGRHSCGWIYIANLRAVAHLELIKGVENMRLQGKTAIVTGAGSGFGAGIAQKFAAEGATVMSIWMPLSPSQSRLTRQRSMWMSRATALLAI
jgi:3-oxoacyl-ACP reductase-like protein